MPQPITRRQSAVATNALALERILTLDEAAELAGISKDSLRRHYSHLIRRLSPRRVGMKLRDALAIGSTT
jgi:predicted transcriptional regulator of viral defense system